MWNCDKVIGLPLEIEDREIPNTGGQWGLWFRAFVSSAETAQDVAIKLVEGIIDRCSVGTKTTEWYEDDNRVLHNKTMELYDISIVPYAANAAAVVTGARNQPDGEKIPPLELIKRLLELQPDELQQVRSALGIEEPKTHEEEGAQIALANENEVIALRETLATMGN